MCLGSNQGDTDANLERAVAAIAALSGLTVEKRSSVYRTEPQEKKNQPWFANQVLRCRCSGWTPAALMQSLLDCETALGRVRDVADPADRFGPRVIDIDLLLFADVESSSSLVTLPHPRMWQRAFVLVPLLEVYEEPEDVTPVSADRQNSLFAAGAIRSRLAQLQFRVERDCIWQ
ncbi:MAG: 2-amino-4-hydroxy-6-hydroxymethyldihydropteridine diphosphokinase [Desulfovibrio alaskensis]|nr:2-amino-4-hydroxy-6-hydroxymethyldihydropteridine diphosphokinase [Oleidesulfovibrio alaskensis]MBL3582646.1 2-amino-4-hydroxy-6-hydroxymethyldihydropteridine diphosphokinase [Oleidesulfovibrio alaskensis]